MMIRLARVLSAIRGDKHMVDAYPPARHRAVAARAACWRCGARSESDGAPRTTLRVSRRRRRVVLAVSATAFGSRQDARRARTDMRTLRARSATGAESIPQMTGRY